jgi:hypothetical protein
MLTVSTFLWSLGAIIAFYVVSYIYERIAFREVTADENGWIMARPGPVSWIIGALCAALTVLMAYLTLNAVFVTSEDRLMFLLLGPPFTALMAFGTVSILWIRVRASNTQVSYRGSRGWTDFDWNDVISIDDHSGLGPRLRISGHRNRYFWPFGYGWAQIGKLFADNDIPFSLS